jgi:GxxExxY protein
MDQMDSAHLNRISGAIVDCAIAVHSALGPGLLESAYQACLQYELRKRHMRVESQVPLPLVYEEVKLELGYRIDLLVEDLVIIELKACEAIAPVHRVQLLSYLKLSNKPLGLLLNFHVVLMKDGIVRMKNGY